MKTQLIFYWLLIASPFMANSQSAILERLIEEGLANNSLLKQQEIDLQKGELAIKMARSYYQPQVSFNASYMLAAGGRSLSFPIGDLLNPVYSTLNSLTSSNDFGQLENVEINFIPNNFQETKIRIGQSIYNPAIKPNIEIQQKLLLSKEAQKASYAHSIRYEITEAYIRFLQSKEAEIIYTNSLDLLNELLKINQSLVRNNVATREVISSTEYEISKLENALFSLRQSQKSAQAFVNFLVNRADLDTPIEVDSSLVKTTFPEFKKEELFAAGLSNRLEINQLNAAMAAAETASNLADLTRKRPVLTVGGEAGLQGFGYHPGDGQLFGIIQFGGSWTIYDGGQLKRKWQETQLVNQQLKLQSEQLKAGILMAITKASFDYEAAKYSLNSATKSIQSASESFKIIRAKYKQQQSLLIEMLEAQNRVTTAQLQLIQSRYDVLSKLLNLYKETGK